MDEPELDESLIEWVGRLLGDPVTRARLARDPVGVFADRGLVDLDPSDVRRALSLVVETLGARLDAEPVEAPGGGPAPEPPTAVPHRRATDPRAWLRCPARHGETVRRTS